MAIQTMIKSLPSLLTGRLVKAPLRHPAKRIMRLLGRRGLVALFGLLGLLAATFYSTSTASTLERIFRHRLDLGSALTQSDSRQITRGLSPETPAPPIMNQAATSILAVADLQVNRRGHTASSLTDGRILIIGGENENGPVSESEIFDPRSRTFSLAARLIIPRTDHTATKLTDGRVLIVGGRGSDGLLESTEIFDPLTNAFSRGPDLHRERAGHSATVLADGRILIAGGDAEGSAELFDPSTESFDFMAAHMNTPRAFHAATLLQDGKVLLAGGSGSNARALRSAELFDAEGMSFSPAQNLMHVARLLPTLHVLPDGKVQIIGGDDENSMEMFNAAGEYFTAYATLLPRSDSLVKILRTQTRAALFVATDKPVGKLPKEVSSTIKKLLDRGDFALAELAQSSSVLVVGGINGNGQVLNSAFALMDSAATVTTDKTDYVPGETVIITGANWQADETVSLTLHRDNGAPDTLLSAAANASGNIRNTEFVIPLSDAGVTYLLTAVGLSSGYTAQTTFTDSPKVGSLSVGSQSPSPVIAGNSATYTITINRGSGGGSSGAFTANLSVTTTLPTGATASFSPTPVSFTSSDTTKTSTLTITTSCATPTATTSFTVRAERTDNTSDFATGNGSLSTTGDSTPPTVSCPSGTTASANASCKAAVPNVLGSVTAMDNCASSGSLTKTQSPAAGTLVGLGTTTITVTVTDPANNTNTCTTTFTVNDTTPPVITLTGANPFTVECHTSFTDPGATASDSCAGSVAVTASGSVNVNTPGSYTITYSASDGTNTAMTTRTVNVVDTTPPVITLTGANPFTVECHTSFTDPGATANDSCAGSVAVTASGSVNVNTPGSYTITYSASDGTNTATKTRTVNVVDTTPPVITLTGANPVTVECHTSFIDPGATANDLCAGSVAVTASGSVNVNTPGSYTITYSASDGTNTATRTRTVNVVDTTPPVITLAGANPVTVECHTSFTDPGATANDLCAGSVAVTASGSVNVNTPGSYTITYTASDSTNTATKTRTVNVVDTTPPSLTAPPAIADYTGPGATSCRKVIADGALGSATASDTCGTATVTRAGVPAGNIFPVGTTTITYTASDGNGNSSTATQTVTIIDNTDPTISCPGNIMVTAAANAASAVVNYTVTASDNCSIASLVSAPPSGSAFPVGITTVNATATDPAGRPASCSFTVTVKSTSTTSVTPATVQYSDVVLLMATVNAVPFPGQPLTGMVQFFINGNPVGSAPTPSGGGVASLPATIALAPGNYNVTAQFTSSNPNYTNSNGGPATLTVTQEDARVTYSGTWFASTATGAAVVTLSATIQDITAVPSDPAYDSSAGDIRNALVKFVNRDTSAVIADNVPVGLVNSSDTKTGTAIYNWSVNIGASDSESYTIGIIVKNYYKRDASADDAVVTVSKALGTEFITGGGYLVLQNSAGQYAGDPGSENNFGFNVKYNHNGRNLKGKINTIVRNGGRVYQYKGNSMTSLVVDATKGTAVFDGKCNLQDITDPANPISIDGNATLHVTMTDRGEPGSSDSIGITVWSKNGGLYFSSNWDGTKTVEQTLGGGNLVVH